MSASKSASRSNSRQTTISQYFNSSSMIKCKRNIFLAKTPKGSRKVVEKLSDFDPNSEDDDSLEIVTNVKENSTPRGKKSRLSTIKSSKKSKTKAVDDVIEISDTEETPRKKVRTPEGVGKIRLRDINTMLETDTRGTPSSSQHFSSNALRIGINKSTQQDTTAEKRKPRILQSIREQNFPNKSQEFVSTDSLSDKTAEILDEIQCNSREELLPSVPNLSEKLKFLLQSTEIPGCVPRSPSTSPRKRSPRKGMSRDKDQSSPIKIVEDLPDGLDQSDYRKLTPLRVLRRILYFIIEQRNLYKLLTHEEECLLMSYFSLPAKHQFFCFRLFTRQQKFYNINKLNSLLNMNVTDQEASQMYWTLQEKQFVVTDYSSEKSADLLELLQLPDIKAICQSFKLKIKNEPKPKLIESLLTYCNKQTTLTFAKSSDEILKQRIGQKLGRCVKLSNSLYKLLYKVHLLYSFATPEFLKVADLHQHINMILYGDIRLPHFKIDCVDVFESPDEFERFSTASEFYNEFQLAFERKDTKCMLEIAREVYQRLQNIIESDANISTYNKRFYYGNKYGSTLSMACNYLTVDHYEEVAQWLKFLIGQEQVCQSKRGFWYDQLAMVMDKYFKNHEEAGNIIVKGLSDPKLLTTCYNNLSARGKALKNNKTKKIPSELKEQIENLSIKPPDDVPLPTVVIDAQAQRSENSTGKRMYFEINELGEKEYISVEEVAKRHYLRTGYTEGVHCEGAVLKNLFAFIFWDIIYENHVPGAFISELQYLPLDFNTLEFYEKRKQAIDKRLAEIETEWSLEHLQNVFTEYWLQHSHEKSLAVEIQNLSLKNYTDIIACLGKSVLSKILSRFAQNFRLYRSGLPDLFLWNPDTKKSIFVEVKGENDKLSMKQKIWLDYLRSIGANIEVCHVHTIGSRAFEKLKVSKMQED